MAARLGWDDGIDIFRGLPKNETTITTFIKDELTSSDVDKRQRAARAAISYGRFQRFSGTGTYELLEHAANIAKKDDNGLLEAQCYLASGSIKLARSLIDKARADFELAKEMYSRQLHHFGVAHCLCQLGDAIDMNLISNKQKSAIGKL